MAEKKSSPPKQTVNELLEQILGNQDQLFYGRGIENIPLGRGLDTRWWEDFLNRPGIDRNKEYEDFKSAKPIPTRVFLDMLRETSKHPLTALGMNTPFVNSDSSVRNAGISNLFMTEKPVNATASGAYLPATGATFLLDNENYPSTLPHESMHAAIRMLKDRYGYSPFGKPREVYRSPGAAEEDVVTRMTMEPPFSYPHKNMYSPEKADEEIMDLLTALATKYFKEQRSGGPR